VAAARPLLPTLTGLRALAATWVVAEHFRHPLFGLLPGLDFLRPWVTSGYLGVEVFFVLSGFVISYNYADRFRSFSRPAYRDFLVARAARLYPVHLVTFAAVLVLVLGAGVLDVALNSDDNYTVASFIGNLFMLQALPGVVAWNSPAWSISAELAAYLAFPLIALTAGRLVRPTVAFGLAISWGALGLAAMMTSARLISDSPTSAGIIWLRIATEFVVGCLLYFGWRALKIQTSRWADIVAVGCVVATSVILLAVEAGTAWAMLALPFIASFVLAVVMARGPLATFLSSRPMDWAGRVSYSLYMTHFLLLIVADKVVPWEQWVDRNLAVRLTMIAGYFVLAYVAAAACYYLVEQPGRVWVKRLLGRRRASVNA
jgi:peptidoglycan/LPS O-acetylase OafA/YrhL